MSDENEVKPSNFSAQEQIVLVAVLFGIIVGAFFAIRWMITTKIGRIVGIALLICLILFDPTAPSRHPQPARPNAVADMFRTDDARRGIISTPSVRGPDSRLDFNNPATGHQGGCVRSYDGSSMSCWSNVNSR